MPFPYLEAHDLCPYGMTRGSYAHVPTTLHTIRIQKGRPIPAALQIGGIDKLMARRRELENMLGEGVDR